MLVPTGRGLLFGGLSPREALRAGRPPNKKTYLLCVLRASAVKILFWTRVTSFPSVEGPYVFVGSIDLL